MDTENVRTQLDGKGMTRLCRAPIQQRGRASVFWGYFPAYDWVAFNWLFGSMDELPFLCLDIKQRAMVPDGRRMLGRFSLASIPSPESGGPPVARTPISLSSDCCAVGFQPGP